MSRSNVVVTLGDQWVGKIFLPIGQACQWDFTCQANFLPHSRSFWEGNAQLFGDLEHAKVLLSLGSELQSRCRKTEHELLGEWIAEVKNELTSSEAGMCTKGKLMEISQEELIVNYSSRLVQLL